MLTIKNLVRNYCSALMLFRIDKRLGLPVQAWCETTHENSLYSRVNRLVWRPVDCFPWSGYGVAYDVRQCVKNNLLT